MAITVSFCWILILLAGCGGKPFNVKSRVTMPAAPASESTANGVTISAAVIRDEDFLVETFDANLILAGVLPVSVALSNRSPQPVDLHKALFEVRSAEGRAYKAVEAKRAYKRLMSYYEIRTYGKSGYRESLDDFGSYALDTRTPLAVGETRRGMIFFVLPVAAVHAPGLKLLGSHLDLAPPKAKIELPLN